MVIRDLTLRSAASFGSFHLIRLLYDEYMFYLVEHRVAQATGETPIAVMGEVREARKAVTHGALTKEPEFCFNLNILLIDESNEGPGGLWSYWGVGVLKSFCLCVFS